MTRLLTFWSDPPTNVLVYPCPGCREVIRLDSANCRFCHGPIDVKLAEQIWVQNQHIATAISRASTYSVTSHAALVSAGIAIGFLFFYGTFREFWIIAPLLAVSYGAQWLNHNKSLVTDDPDFLKAVTKVKWAMRIWAASLVVQVAAYLFFNGLPDWATILELFVVE